MNKIILFSILLLAICKETSASYEAKIAVNECDIKVIVLTSEDEHIKGMLGYDNAGFPYEGMLFKMDAKKRKIFHTLGMKMTIYIMGVNKDKQGRYHVTPPVYLAPPGISKINIYGEDVLEIPENIYKINFRRCINVREVVL